MSVFINFSTINVVMLGIMLAANGLMPVRVAAETASQVKQTSEKTVDIDIQTQEAMEAWMDEERQLLAKIEKVRADLKRTRWHRQKAATYRETLEKKVAELNQRAAEMEIINRELLWVLDQTLDRLQTFVEADLPYDRITRRERLFHAERILNDYDMGLLQKTHAVFDALARETDLGHSAVVKDAEIDIAGQPKQVKLLRLGRVGLYALTMDTRHAYRWDIGQQQWLTLASGIRNVEETIEMAEGIRIIGLTRLPLERPVAPDSEHSEVVP